MLADAAGHKVVEIELFEGAPDGIADLSRRARRLEKERPAGELGPGRTQESQIQRFGKAHAHGTSNPHLTGSQRVFHENRQPVDQQGLRDAVHDRTQHGVDPHLIRKGTPEFNQRAPVIETVPVEKAVQTRLNPLAEWLEQKRRDDDGDHAAAEAIRRRMEDFCDQCHEREINRGDTRSGHGIRQAALKDNIHVHQTVTDDGVPETQRDKPQTQHGDFRPPVWSGVKHERKNVKQGNRETADESSASKPFQLLTKDAGGRFTVTPIENQPSRQEARREITVFDLPEQEERAGPGHKTKDI